MILKIDPKTELHQLKLTDSEDIFKVINHQRGYLGRWLPFIEKTKSQGDTAQYVNSVVNAPESQFEYVFTIRYNGEFAGLLGFKDTDRENKKTELGYWISENFQKRGIVTQSVKRICDFAFNKLHINRITIKCAVGNSGSERIPQRLGFKFEGIEREGELLGGNTFTDLKVYSKLKSDLP